MIVSDVIIIGGGPVGCVLAEKISSDLKLNCLIIEKRSHIGGNCYDEYNSKGLLYHKYGPHYLRFKNKKTMNYLSKFTKWLPGDYIVKSSINKKLYPIPINLTTLEMFFGRKFKSKKEVLKFLDKKKVKINNPKNFEEFVLSKLGKDIYDNFYKNYTIKQWNIHPSKLSKEIAGRLPIRFNRNPYYVKEKLRYMPKKGFTQMFKNMTANKRIKIKLNSDFFKIKNKLKFNHFMIYTGEPDRYFDFKYGKLDWRSLIFKFKTFKKNKVQKCVQYNFPNDFKYTRSVEIKHVTKQRSKFTVISKEYPTSRGEPYYPISNNKNIKLFEKYKKLIVKEMHKNIYFEGRLAKYKYFNTDEVIESALSLFNSLKKKYKNN
jgi:UDP-galactopyranose mutase